MHPPTAHVLQYEGSDLFAFSSNEKMSPHGWYIAAVDPTPATVPWPVPGRDAGRNRVEIESGIKKKECPISFRGTR